MLEHINKWVCWLSLAASIIWQCQFIDIMEFMIYYPLFSFHMLVMSILSTIGQMFVYRMIKQFKQHVVPFVITTRKLFTVVLSIIFYGHVTTWLQGLGILLVFGVVCADFVIELQHDAGGDIQTGNKSV